MTNTQKKKAVSGNSTHDIATNLRWVGWIGFWLQLGLAVVAGLCLLFARSGRNLAEEEIKGIGVAIFFASVGLIAIAINIYLSFRYTRIGKRILNPQTKPQLSRSDTVNLLRLGLLVGFTGIFLNLLGAGSGIGVQIAKAVSQPPGVAITDPSKIIRALDVYVVAANVNGIASNFFGIIVTMWLFYKVGDNKL